MAGLRMAIAADPQAAAERPGSRTEIGASAGACQAGKSGKPTALRAPVRSSELDLGRVARHAPLGLVEVEELLLGKAQHAGHQHGREALTLRVVLGGRIVEEAARSRDLVLDVGQLALQLLEVRVGLEVG